MRDEEERKGRGGGLFLVLCCQSWFPFQLSNHLAEEGVVGEEREGERLVSCFVMLFVIPSLA